METHEATTDSSLSNSGLTDTSTKEGLEDDLAKGLFLFLQPPLKDIYMQMEEIKNSQNDFTCQLDKIDLEIEKIKINCDDIPELTIYIQKMLDSKKRITNIRTVLNSTYTRLHNLHQNIMKEATKKKAILEP
ncbi:unnamed protein product [Gordionus sp. m RMFG-2023]|uniref:SNARE-associated protein Snapin-like isoform X1 n=1 Tax=Gordionus sp. m RMFG-2023 TaxID=3053472 RepID=UPI0030DE8951